MSTRRLWMMWWSGVFALATVVHLMRALANIPLIVGPVHVAVWISWVIFPLTGLAAVWLMRHALEFEERLPPPPWERLGGCHPKSAAKEAEFQHAGQPYCGVYVGYHAVGEDDEEE